MSAILIRGMKIPKDREIHLRIDEKGEVYVYGSYPTELYKAVPVPPHGRLGDLDDFAKRMKSLVEKAENDGFDLVAAWYSTFVRHIELTPTIIPAEEGE